MSNLRRQEQELARQIERLVRSLGQLEGAAKKTAQAEAKKLTGQRERVLGKLEKTPDTFGGGFLQGTGIADARRRIASQCVAGVAGQLAGRAALGGAAGLALGGAAVTAQFARTGLDAAGRGQDVGAALGLTFDKLLSAIPGLGVNAERRVQATEGTISDLNALTGDLAALGFDTENLRQEAAPIFREQQRRRIRDQERNQDIAQQQNLNEQLGRSLNEKFGSAGMEGIK